MSNVLQLEPTAADIKPITFVCMMYENYGGSAMYIYTKLM